MLLHGMELGGRSGCSRLKLGVEMGQKVCDYIDFYNPSLSMRIGARLAQINPWLEQSLQSGYHYLAAQWLGREED